MLIGLETRVAAYTSANQEASRGNLEPSAQLQAEVQANELQQEVYAFSSLHGIEGKRGYEKLRATQALLLGEQELAAAMGRGVDTTILVEKLERARASLEQLEASPDTEDDEDAESESASASGSDAESGFVEEPESESVTQPVPEGITELEPRPQPHAEPQSDPDSVSLLTELLQHGI